ncbi:hypothetical protein FISHEDRAFT_36889, partial [Fistulina hepatica ATCC 64428]
NLLRTLTQSQTKVVSSDLKLLLANVKAERVHDGKAGDQFYESLDNLLAEIRTVTMDNHDAEAFLKPVLRADYPDYFTIITNPMDLSTMTRKVKNKQYKSKREFQDDLDLIWSNCFTYNSSDNHPLRQCASRLRAKAECLLRYVTDRKDRANPPIPSQLSSDAPSSNGIARRKVNGVRPGTSLSRSVSSETYPQSRKHQSFAESPAILRTRAGMSEFMDIDNFVEGKPGSSSMTILGRHYSRQVSRVGDEASFTPSEDGGSGDKRKLLDGPSSPRKRARQDADDTSSDDAELTNLWWDAVETDSLLGNGLPTLRFPSSSAVKTYNRSGKRRSKQGRPKPPPPPKALLTLMNANIRTIKRVRQTHAKFSNLVSAQSNENNEDGDGPTVDPPPSTLLVTTVSGDDETVIDDQVDERPWRLRGRGKAGIEMGEANATHCLRWAGSKVLEHSGFQGTSSAALDVLAGVASDYLFNIGRTLQYLSDKYGHVMTPEEIVLHALFEGGVSGVPDLERHITDDIERYGARLRDLEKKLSNAYRDITSVEEIDDEGLFTMNDEDETSALAMGDFADVLGEDYLGLRELGIAAEFGIANLTVPKRLFLGKKAKGALVHNGLPKEPPLPYPPPPPLECLDSAHLDEQIGLLQPYFRERIEAIRPLPTTVVSTPAALPIPSLPSVFIPSLSGPSLPGMTQPPRPPVVLPDDVPAPSQTKVGPLGQIIRPSVATKKKKSQDGDRGSVGTAAADAVPTKKEPAPKKKKANQGIGSGNWKRQKSGDRQQSQSLLPPPPPSSQPQPPVVTASA